MKALRTASLLGSLAILAALSPAAITSTFDTGAEGWRIVNYPDNATNGDYDYTLTPDNPSAVTYNATGGNPGGYISTPDPNSEDFYFQAPAKFLGNDLSAYGTNLTYDLADDSGNEYNTAATVVLKGAGLTAVYDAATVPGTAFTPFSIPLAETGWRSNSYLGAAISQANFKTILSNLTSFELRGRVPQRPGNQLPGQREAPGHAGARRPSPRSASVWSRSSAVARGADRLRFERAQSSSSHIVR